MAHVSAAPVAQLEAVAKRRGAVMALSNLTLAIRPGQVTALLGPNGAGKSTVVALLTGRLWPDEGRAKLFEQDPRRAAVRTRLGVMLQQVGLPQLLTVAEQIDLFRGYYPDPRSREEVVAIAGLSGLEQRRCAALSGGQQRCLHFAMAMGGRPDFLVLDEPTTGLDVNARRSLWGAIREEAARGAAILLTTHYLEEAEALADRVVVIDQGRVIADGAPDSIKAGVAATAIRCRTRLSDAELTALPGVISKSQEGARAIILTNNPPLTLRRLLAVDDTVADIAVSGASLEDAFTRLLERSVAQVD